MLFFSGMAALGFLTTGASKHSRVDRPSVLDMGLAAVSIAAGVYFVRYQTPGRDFVRRLAITR